MNRIGTKLMIEDEESTLHFPLISLQLISKDDTWMPTDRKKWVVRSCAEPLVRIRMKLITATILACAILLSFSCPLWSAESNVENTIKQFINVVAGKDRKALAHLVSYPLQRRAPLASIDNPGQFLEVYDEIIDEKIIMAISTSRASSDWSEMGWRGIMFQNGLLWLDEEGKITAINYETEKGKRKRAELIKADRSNVNNSLRNFAEPVLEWETTKFRIRIDRLTDNKFRYSAWPVNKKTTEQPDLVLRNGSITFDGSGGNHHYDFESGPYHYRCIVNVIGAEMNPPGELQVTRLDKVVLSQPVVKVITGR